MLIRRSAFASLAYLAAAVALPAAALAQARPSRPPRLLQNRPRPIPLPC